MTAPSIIVRQALICYTLRNIAVRYPTIALDAALPAINKAIDLCIHVENSDKLVEDAAREIADSIMCSSLLPPWQG